MPASTPSSVDAVPGLPISLDGGLLRLIAAGPDAAASSVATVTEDRYKRFLDALGVAVYTTDADGRITFFNRAAVDFWGRAPDLGEEWCGSFRLFATDGAPMAHAVCPMAMALRERRPVRGEEAIAERPDGTRVWFTPYPTPLFDDSNELIGAVNVLIDMTERRRAEEGLRSRDRALAASNAVRDEFLGLVSHELRTPVTTILGNAVLLDQRGVVLDPDVRRTMIQDIAVDAARLQAIVDNLLQLTRIESGIEVELEPQVLQRNVERAVERFRRRFPDRIVTLDMPRATVLVDGDATYLDLLVDNLLGNAQKYSQPGTMIEVVMTADGGEVLVQVLDRGIGLADAPADELFRPFFRSVAARTAASGLGIGLALCQRIVDALGGRISAAAREGGGTTVCFALPILPLEGQI